MYYENNKSIIYYGVGQEEGNECKIYHQVYGLWTLSGHYIVIHVKSFLISWADDTPRVEDFVFDTEDAMNQKLNELKLEYNLVTID